MVVKTLRMTKRHKKPDILIKSGLVSSEKLQKTVAFVFFVITKNIKTVFYHDFLFYMKVVFGTRTKNKIVDVGYWDVVFHNE